MVAAPEPPAAPSLRDLHRAVRSACLRNDDDKPEKWADYQRAWIDLRYALRRDEATDLLTQEELRRRITPGEQTEGAQLTAFLTFCRLFGVVKEPRPNLAGSDTLPFIPYPEQETLAATLIGSALDGGTVVVEKSRDMGATWLALHLVVWLWLIRPGVTWHLGSRTEPLVDKNAGSRDDDTLFGRCEIIVDALPTYLQPRGYDLDDKTHRQQHLWVNWENRNRLTGESSNANFGHQQRKTGLLIDEAARWEHQASVIRGTVDTCWTRWFITSPHPDAEAIKDLMELPDTVVLRQHWSQHPLKTLAWYREQQRRRRPEDLAEQVDISWEGAFARTIYPEWQSVPKGDFPFDPAAGVLCGAVDFGRRDGTGIELYQVHPDTRRVRFLLSHYSAGNDITYYFPFFARAAVASGQHVYSDAEQGQIRLIHDWISRAGSIVWFGDPAGRQLPQGQQAPLIGQILTATGVTINTTDRIKSHDERQARARVMLRNAECNIALCKSLDLSLRNYRYPEYRPGATRLNRRPLHDRWSHEATAVEYAADGLDSILGRVSAPAPPERHRAAWEVGAA